MKKILAVLVLLALASLTVAAFAVPSDPKEPFTVVRLRASGGLEFVTPANGMVRGCVAKADTLGHCKDCTYIGGPKYRWMFFPDSTDTYTFWETGGPGPDSVQTDMENLAMFGPGLMAPDSSVRALALRPDTDGIFRPGHRFLFGSADTLFIRYLDHDSTDVVIRVLAEMWTQNLAIDTTKALLVRKSLGGGVYTSNYVLRQVADRITLESDSASISIGEVDTTRSLLVDADSLHALVAKIGEGGAGEGLDVDGPIYGTGNLSIDGKLTAGNAAADSISALGDIRARGGDIVAGTAGQAGAVGISDGSSNTTTLAQVPWGSNVTVNLPLLFVDCKLADVIYVGVNEYRWSYYIAGVDSSWAAQVTASGLYDPGGAYQEETYPAGGSVATVTRPYQAYCKTDSLVITSHGCCTGDEFTHVFALLGKKNLFLTR